MENNHIELYIELLKQQLYKQEDKVKQLEEENKKLWIANGKYYSSACSIMMLCKESNNQGYEISKDTMAGLIQNIDQANKIMNDIIPLTLK